MDVERHVGQLGPLETVRMRGDIVAVKEKLEELEIGSYLIQFFQHSVAYVKTDDLIAVFEPNEGLALFDKFDQIKKSMLVSIAIGS